MERRIPRVEKYRVKINSRGKKIHDVVNVVKCVSALTSFDQIFTTRVTKTFCHKEASFKHRPI